jgi:arylsulfatase A-like enzyme
VPIPQSLTQPFDVSGRPKAHGEFENMWSYVLGRIPPEADRWRRFNDFYVNSIRSVDVQVDAILNELDALQLADRTIVIFTSDHGEMAGAHGLRGKGPFAYEENLHLPFYVIHPDVKGGQDCRALSGHIDLVPSLLAMAGVDATKRAEFAGRQLPGKDLTQLLTNPSAAEVHAQREAVLYTYSCLATNDSGVFQIAAEAKAAGKKPALALLKRRYVPDMKKRGSVRTAFDGRYKFSRYFSPLDHNHPTTLDQLYSANDVELFDLDADPQEVTNLAADKNANQDLIMAMNGKLETVIKAEIGLDDGRELPNIPLVTWTIDRVS